MSAEAQISLRDYLETEFEGPAPEYVDGELAERSMTSLEHSRVQSKIHLLLGKMAEPRGLHCYVEVPMRVAGDGVRVPDIAVFEGSEPSGRIAEQPPLLIVEVLSPWDTWSGLRRRVHAYEGSGVAHIWLADPDSRELYKATDVELRRVSALELPDFDLRVAPEEVFPQGPGPAQLD
ncbi:MAG: hypothetical protein GC160_07410 [Acidobacteria bacterium]|nr:hypothetical protein [Acidobacteriota bacterium]